MYQKHTDFIEPDNPETILWRYRPYKYFLSILENKSLYFSSIPKLREKNDRKEGTFPESNINAYLTVADATPTSGQVISNQFHREMPETLSSPFRVINCWNMREAEVKGMWREYANEGVAIKTTFKRLIESFDKAPKKLSYPDGTEVPIHAGKVFYINRNEQSIPNDPFSWYLVTHKDREFQHEKELRVAAEFLPSKYGLSFNPDEWEKVYPHNVDSYPKQLREEKAIYIPADLNTLIDTVVISPFAEPELKEEVENVLRKHSVSAKVKLSDISASSELGVN